MSRLVAGWAWANDVRLSCGRIGSCYDNTFAESLFAAPKSEMYHRKRFPIGAAAGCAVIEFIETYYNRRWPHYAIGYRIPAEVMEEFFERTGSTKAMPIAIAS